MRKLLVLVNRIMERVSKVIISWVFVMILFPNFRNNYEIPIALSTYFIIVNILIAIYDNEYFCKHDLHTPNYEVFKTLEQGYMSICKGCGKDIIKLHGENKWNLYSN